MNTPFNRSEKEVFQSFVESARNAGCMFAAPLERKELRGASYKWDIDKHLYAIQVIKFVRSCINTYVDELPDSVQAYLPFEQKPADKAPHTHPQILGNLDDYLFDR
ncbi:MAG: hypothetical protein AAF329_12740 [Cyanobacteria bacterium P01_A01_bin.17]